MSNACPNATNALLECVRESKCMQEDRKTFQDCWELMKNDDPSIENRCYGLRNALYACRKGQFDQRLRFRGRNRDLIPEELENKPPTPVES